jgi:phage FluMu gp28-like protein
MTLPTALLPYQCRWMADRSRVRVWEKSRRIGASWVCAAESVYYAALQNGGCSTWYTSYNKETTAEFIRDCASWAKAIASIHTDVQERSDVDDEGDEFLTYVIRFSTGHRITTLSSKPTNLRNRKGRIIIDEAAHIPDLAETLKAAIAILMWGGSVDVLSTHNGVDSPFNKLVDDIKTGRRNYSLHKTDLTQALQDGLFKRICLVNGWEWSQAREDAWRIELIRDYDDFAAEELFCVPSRSGGMYLNRILIEDQMLDRPVLRFEAPEGFAQRPDDQRARTIQDWLERHVESLTKRLPSGLLHTFGMDFGRTADLSVIVPVTITQKLRREIPFMLELRDVPFREQEQALNFVVDRLPRFVYGALDATGNGQYMAERAWQRYGQNVIEQVTLNDKWYGEHFPPMKAALEDSMLFIPRDADVLSDLMTVELINGVPKLPKSRQSQKAGVRSSNAKRHGDAAIAIVLAHYATRQQLPVYDYQPVSGGGAGHRLSRSRGFRGRKGAIL